MVSRSRLRSWTTLRNVGLLRCLGVMQMTVSSFSVTLLSSRLCLRVLSESPRYVVGILSLCKVTIRLDTSETSGDIISDRLLSVSVGIRQ